MHIGGGGGETGIIAVNNPLFEGSDATILEQRYVSWEHQVENRRTKLLLYFLLLFCPDNVFPSQINFIIQLHTQQE